MTQTLSGPGLVPDAELRADVLEALGTVLDPELHEAVTTLGFVSSCAVRDGRAEVRLRVTDHTDGFDLPAGPPSPPALDQEHGRGLFIIRSLMDEVRYERGGNANSLAMRKVRQVPPAR